MSGGKSEKRKSKYSRIIFFAWLILILTVNIALSNKSFHTNLSADNQADSKPDSVLLTPPDMIFIPESDIYFAPDSSIDRFFHSGYWYASYNSQWFRATYYNGPWSFLSVSALPDAISSVPKNYRELYSSSERISYREMKKRTNKQTDSNRPKELK
ncbi:MAG: hypothetical protein RBT37_01310 [Dissulfurispiraceae bacterium]|jgi:hypothetical protein|nr:hypothetical protein [Dissulfurispiraceae bacterium]